jgi:alkane 1-monooxygenase
VDYVSHYGLLRQKRASGRYERCTAQHCWNSDHLVTNIVLYQLQRHSDHHLHPTRRWQTLRSFDGAPKLPSGLPGTICLAYFPPLWRRVMDRRVLELYRGDVTEANLHPAKRQKLLARYGAGSTPGSLRSCPAGPPERVPVTRPATSTTKPKALQAKD